VLAEVTAREIGRVTIAEALELTSLVARKQPDRYGRFAARLLCICLEEHEQATLEHVELLVSDLRSLATRKDHAAASRRACNAQAQGGRRGVTTRVSLPARSRGIPASSRQNPGAEAASRQGRGSGGRSCESVDPSLRLPGEN
jgi:hypothetical protein